MMYIIAIPLGILFGFIIDKAYAQGKTIGFLVALTPYFFFFILSSENKSLWADGRIIAFLSTLIAIIYYISISNIRKKSNKIQS